MDEDHSQEQCKCPVPIQIKSKRKKNKAFNLFSQDELINHGLEGFVRANEGLVLLEGQRTILRRDYQDLNQVKLLGGGRMGHDPLYSGFVGPGMLTAVCLGNKHSFPSHQKISVAIRELASNTDKGVIVIIESCLEGKLNFGLAVECAKRDGIQVRIVLVKDNCSENLSGSKKKNTNRKGQVGIVFVYKIAAAMAEAGECLEAIHEFCEYLASSRLATINIRLPEKLPTKKTLHEMYKTYSQCDHLKKSNKMTLVEVVGDLIQGGVTEKFIIDKKHELTDLVLKYLINRPKMIDPSGFALPIAPLGKIVLLFNNFGSADPLLINTIVNEISIEMNRQSIEVERIYLGTVMRSSKCTFSLTVMKVNDNILNLLKHPTVVSGWPTVVLCEEDSSEGIIVEPSCGQYYSSEKELGPILADKSVMQIKKIINTVCLALISCEDQINKIGEEQQLGNIGTLVKKSADRIRTHTEEGVLNLKCPHSMFKQMSVICSEEMSCLVGTYYGIMLQACSQAFIKYFRTQEVDISMWIEALEDGINAIEFYSEAEIGEKTLLDALHPMLNVLKLKPERIVEAAEAAEIASWKTIEGTNQNYPSLETHIVAIWSRALAEGINLVKIENDYSKVLNEKPNKDKGEDIDNHETETKNENIIVLD